jgi:hypothetical protein
MASKVRALFILMGSATLLNAPPAQAQQALQGMPSGQETWKLYFQAVGQVPEHAPEPEIHADPSRAPASGAGPLPIDRSDLERLAQDRAALNEVASLRPEPALRWKRLSPTAERLDGPVLYTIIFRSNATANYVPKIAPNYTLTNSLIFDDGANVGIGALSIAADGTITFKSGQPFPGTGPGTITGVTAGTRLTGGGTTGTVSLSLDAPTTAFLNSFGQTPGYSLSSPTGAANYCIIGQLLLFAFTPTGLTTIVPADGRLLPIAGNTALFSVLGTTFGGDGTSNFAVPDMRKMAPNNMTWSICVQGVFP